MTTRVSRAIVVVLLSGVAVWAGPSSLARQRDSGAAAIDPDDIGGVVTSAKGPEAGVWVIAEATTLPTRFRKIVVTDDRGRYVVPDLPRGTYSLWVRGYGLVDSKPVQATPGKSVPLQAVIAPSPQAAAAVYPPNYWYSLLKVPDTREFPGTGPKGNGIAPGMLTQAHWLSGLKDGCQLCHQMGGRATRQIPDSLGTFHSGVDAWERRLRSGQRGAQMTAALNRLGKERALALFADWTDRIAGGEVPPQPPRPEGIERNLVLTLWDWGTPTSYIHDEIATDRRNPTVNANGRVYGVDFTTDQVLWVDPVEHTSGGTKISVIAPGAPSFMPLKTEAPSPYFGDELVWNNPVNPHNPMMDARGRVWTTSAVRPVANPDYCKAGSANPYAKYFPLERSTRQASVYDPKTGQMTPVDTCFSTHHLQFAEDKDHTLYFSGDTNVIGWVKTRVFDETRDAARSQGWCPAVVDLTGDGKAGAYTQPNTTLEAGKDMRVSGFAYGIIVNPVDGSIWWASPGVPGRIGRLDLGSNPPETCRAEVFEPPFDPARLNSLGGYAPRGIDVDRNGVIWTALSSGPHMAGFDRRKCKVLNGPTATGQHCPEGWKMYPAPGPQMKGTSLPGSSDFSYYNWVDQFDTLGLGRNVPIMNGSGSDALLAVLPQTGKFVVLRVPYPMGFYSRGLDGRIDDPKAGWKGRGVWADFGTNLPWHIEGGKGTRSAIVKFQLRPDPLAH
ncbi:MAG TPA: hypothetical protein VGQ10_16285 [Vicinamibacterales bacterium]|nr:hypothetical protein [Vicinamibacterales bacterium]